MHVAAKPDERREFRREYEPARASCARLKSNLNTC